MSPNTQQLIDLKCEDLKLTTAEANEFARHAGEKQAASGIKGPDGAANCLAGFHVDFFKARVRAVHAGVLEVIAASDSREDLDGVPVYVDGKIRPFVQLIQQKLTAISPRPWSQKEPTTTAMYAPLKSDFDFKAGVAIRAQEKQAASPKSYHVHGPNFGQVGDGNSQDVVVKTGDLHTAMGGSTLRVEAPGKEKGVFLKYFWLPALVVVVGIAITWLVEHLLKK